MPNRLSPKICPTCNKEFIPRWDQYQIYCSKECYKFGPVGIIDSFWYRDVILKRDHYACTICHSPDKKLHIHHIKTRNEGGNDLPSNLITLCKDCHRELHKELRRTRRTQKQEEATKVIQSIKT